MREEARPTQVILNDGNRVFTIERDKFDLHLKHLWLRPYPGNAKKYNYVIINSQNPKQHIYITTLPVGYAVFKSKKYPNIELYYYDNNNLDDAFREKHKELMKKLGKEAKYTE